jgi:hypothetical protein
MKKICVLLLLLAPGLLAAQKLEDIMKGYDKAMGGLEKWQKLKTLKRSGKMKRDGIEYNYVEQIINNKAKRMEETVNGSSNIAVVNDGTGWKQSGTGKAVVMPAAEVKEMMKETDLMNELLDYKARGHEIALVGDDKDDGVVSHKIKLVKKNGDVEYYFIDPKTYLLTKQMSKRRYNGQWTDVVISYNNYQVIGGMKMPQKVIVKDPLGDVLEDNLCEKMDVNLVFSKFLFDMPAK